MLLAGAAQAHFQLNVNIRVIHVEHLQDGLRVYLRVPMALLVAGLVGPEKADGTRVPAPYTVNRLEGGRLMHLLDPEALRAEPAGLGRLVAEGHELRIGSVTLEPKVEGVRAHPATRQPRFSTLAQARAALAGPPYDPGARATYVGDTVVDVALFYETARSTASYAFFGRLKPGIAGEEQTANLLLDHAGGDTLVYRASGLLEAPIEVSRSRLGAALTFVAEGVRHILEGYDHVLFVLCLAVGALTLGSLLWRATGFTLGHTVTLIAGFLGYAPQGAWFIPSVEAAIALSIVYAGIVAMGRKPAVRGTAWITAAIGLLHGFGFSFVLREILRLESPDLWPGLVAFNIGVEIGQVAIILAVWPLLILLDRFRPAWARRGRVAVALPCIAVAALWTGERLAALLQQSLA